MSDQRTKRWLAILRVAVGVLFIHNALPNLSARFLLGFSNDLSVFARGNPFPWYQSFLTGVVAPHGQVFAIAALLAELLVGIALVMGFLSGLASVLGFVLSANYLLATSHLASDAVRSLPPAFEAPNIYTLLIFIILFVGRAGRTWGVDARLGQRGLFW